MGTISTGNKREKEGGREGLMILHVSAERAVNVFDKNAQLQNFSEAYWDQVCRLRSMRHMVSRYVGERLTNV